MGGREDFTPLRRLLWIRLTQMARLSHQRLEIGGYLMGPPHQRQPGRLAAPGELGDDLQGNGSPLRYPRATYEQQLDAIWRPAVNSTLYLLS